MLSFKPEAKRTWDKSLRNIIGYIDGSLKPIEYSTEKFKGIENKEEALEYINNAINSDSEYISCDTETTGLFPRDGYVLGISLAYEEDSGV
ncbi:uncharacterized protein METZ01_LOCUS226013, partial [marine metagenome]